MQNVRIELSRDNLIFNARLLKKTAADAELFAVVKDDAYGVGARRVTKILSPYVCGFCVNNVSEAVALRSYGCENDILIIGNTPPKDAPRLIRYGLIQSVFSAEYARLLAEAATAPLRVHLALDTGMNRIGFKTVSELAAVRSLPKLKTEGLYTHFAAADLLTPEGAALTALQYGRFRRVAEELKQRGFCLSAEHCANTAAVLNYPDYCRGYIRCGIGLYGVFGEEKGFKEAVALESKVLCSKTLTCDDYVSYGCTRARDGACVTISAGYADGYPKGLSDKGETVINGSLYRVEGAVCMNMVCMWGAKPQPYGAKTVLWGMGGALSARQAAALAGISPYELLCGLKR